MIFFFAKNHPKERMVFVIKIIKKEIQNEELIEIDEENLKNFLMS